MSRAVFVQLVVALAGLGAALPARAQDVPMPSPAFGTPPCNSVRWIGPPPVPDRDPNFSRHPPGEPQPAPARSLGLLRSAMVCFAPGSAELDEYARAILRHAAQAVNESRLDLFYLRGLAEPAESDADALAEQRAFTVRDFLVSLGVGADRLGPLGAVAKPNAPLAELMADIRPGAGVVPSGPQYRSVEIAPRRDVVAVPPARPR